jgi:hypothetical protein
MANQIYKDHFLVWTSRHDKQANRWIPEIIISWSANGGYYLHTFTGEPQILRFAALDLGKELAEKWVNEKP